MPRWIWVTCGGAIGTAFRYGIFTGLEGLGVRVDSALTIVVNMLGAFLLGVLVGMQQAGVRMSPDAASALNVGLLGGLTTYSALVGNLHTLGGERRWPMVGVLVATHLIGGPLMMWVGLRVAT